jgi:ABC transporter substrate binding protein
VRDGSTSAFDHPCRDGTQYRDGVYSGRVRALDGSGRSRARQEPVPARRHFTGFTYVDPEMIGKWMGLLGDMVPQLTRIGLLYNPAAVGAYRTFVPQVQANHRPDNLELVAMPVRRAGEMEAAINALATRQGGGLLVGPDPFNQIHLKHIAKLTTQSRLPAVSVYRSFVMEGGLMMYGPDTADFSAVGCVRRPHPQGCQSGRTTGSAAEQVRVHHQLENRKVARSHGAADAADHR